ncbi:hypothetical protein [Amycolatopsis sp. cmx-11-32]|uniref:hypothetical protein n=1 Tax=Amycolatopsis sp. cmx-11-32 TaxID=2785796 RepID=UPI0039E58402
MTTQDTTSRTTKWARSTRPRSDAAAAFGVRRQAEPLVTPVADPHDDGGRRLR